MKIYVKVMKITRTGYIILSKINMHDSWSNFDKMIYMVTNKGSI